MSATEDFDEEEMESVMLEAAEADLADSRDEVARLRRALDRIADLWRSLTPEEMGETAAEALGRPLGRPAPAPRMCTCLGSCRGAEGLAPGWVCAIARGPAPPTTTNGEAGE